MCDTLRSKPVADVLEKIPLGSGPLSPRQAAFVQEYIIDLNGTQAAIRAGYSPTSAGETGCELLKYPNVAAALEKAKAQRASRVAVTQDSVLHEMSLLANASVDHYFVDEHGDLKAKPEAPDGAIRAVASIKKTTRIDKDDNITYTVEFKLWDKPGSLKLMGRHINLFPDRVEHTGAGGGPIETVSKVERVVVDPAAEKV